MLFNSFRCILVPEGTTYHGDIITRNELIDNAIRQIRKVCQEFCKYSIQGLFRYKKIIS
jgi:hypothetical protein